MESRNVMKKYIGILAKITGFILIVILAMNIILPLIKRNPDAAYEKELEQTTFTEETMKDVGGNQAGKKNAERIRCIDDNEEALLWRLRMIGNAKKSIVLSTFDLRPDDSGTKIIAALYTAAERCAGTDIDRRDLSEALSGKESGVSGTGSTSEYRSWNL